MVEKLAHAAEYSLTEGLIQRQRAYDLENALLRRNQETKGKRGTLSTTLATTGAELLKLREEFDQLHQGVEKSPPDAPRKQIRPVRTFKTPKSYKTRVRFVHSPTHEQNNSNCGSSGTRAQVLTDSEGESVASGSFSEGSTIIVRTASLSIAQTSPACRSPPPRSQTPPSPSPAPRGKGKQVEGPSERVLRSHKQ